ncbi:MAG: hypothetical protein LBQ24_00935 [Candidatus Peribacteria bacterium]|nr:hypothetical protein [Candidatus Peribacteria bacterium]
MSKSLLAPIEYPEVSHSNIPSCDFVILAVRGTPAIVLEVGTLSANSVVTYGAEGIYA